MVGIGCNARSGLFCETEFLVDSMPQECKALVLSGPESPCPAHYLLLQVGWVEWHGTVTFVREVIFPGEVIGAAKEEF